MRAVFKLKESSSCKVRNKVRELFLEKSRKQPCDKKTLGCVFKNPEKGKDVAWKLIDGAGMRGKKEGFAAVSEKHANFIVNEGGATSEEVKKLISKIKAKVLEKFSIELEEEIEIF